MHTEEKSTPTSLLARLGGSLIGAAVSAFAAGLLFFIAAVLDILPVGATFTPFYAPIGGLGLCAGFALPRQAFQSLWFFFPEILDRR